MITVTVSDLTTKVNEGWKKDALAEHYGLPVTQMTQLLKDAGLRIRKFHRPKYELVDDTVEVATPTPQPDPQVEAREETPVGARLEELLGNSTPAIDEQITILDEIAEREVEAETVEAVIPPEIQGEIADAGVSATADAATGPAVTW